MNPLHVIFHVVNPTEHPSAATPLALHERIVLRLVPVTVLLAGEPACYRLRTAVVSAKEVLAMPVEVLAQVAAASEDGGRRAPRVGAAPGAVSQGETVAGEIFGGNALLLLLLRLVEVPVLVRGLMMVRVGVVC